MQSKVPAARGDYSTSSQSYQQDSSSHRATQLEPFIQEQCSDAVQSMAQELDIQLQHLGQPGMDLDGAKLVEQALLLGVQTHHLLQLDSLLACLLLSNLSVCLCVCEVVHHW